MKKVYKASKPGGSHVSEYVTEGLTSRTTSAITRLLVLICFAVLGSSTLSAQGGCPTGACTVTCPADISLCLAPDNYGNSAITPQWVAGFTSSPDPECNVTRVWRWDPVDLVYIEIIDPILVDCDDVNEVVEVWVTREKLLWPECRSSYVPVNVHIKDCEPPVILCPAPATFVCNEDVPRPGTEVNGFRVITLAQFQALGGSATDACGISQIRYRDVRTSNPDNICRNDRTMRREFFAVDVNGNTSQCNQNITVSDNVAPTFTQLPANLTLNCSLEAGTMSSFIISWLSDNTDPEDGPGQDAVVLDNCPENNVTITAVPGTPSEIFAQMPAPCDPNPREVIVVFTATDGCGNQATASARVIIVDTEAPTVSPIPNSFYSCLEAVPAPDPAFLLASAYDNCTPPNQLERSYVSFQYLFQGNCPNSVTIERLYKVVDCDGNASFRTHTIYVSDDTRPWWNPAPQSKFIYNICDPLALDAEIQEWLDENGYGIPQDNCNGPITVTYNRTVIDIRQELLNFCNPANGESNSSVVVFTATDACGNATTASATIRLTDSEPPNGTPPADATYDCADDVPQMLANQVTFLNDNCQEGIYVSVEIERNPTPENGCAAYPFVIIRSWRLTDCAGNSRLVTQRIQIQDRTAPNWTNLPDDFNRNCDAGTLNTELQDWLNNGGQHFAALDACSGSNLTYSTVPASVNGILENLGACAPNSGQTTVMFIARDECGNSVTATATVTIPDYLAPTGEANPSSYECPTEVPAPNTDVVINEQDNCSDDVTVTFLPNATTNNGGTGCVGNPLIITRWYNLTDCTGNSASVSHRITVADETAPQALCQAITRHLDDDCSITVNASEFDNGSYDNCGIKKIEVRRGSTGPWFAALTFTGLDIPNIQNCNDNVSNSAIITIQIRVTDNCDQVDYCTTTITLIDDTPPTIECPADMTIYTSDRPGYDCRADAQWTHPVPQDNCAVGCMEMEVMKEINGVWTTINPQTGAAVPNYRTNVLNQAGQQAGPYNFGKGPYCDDNQYKITYYVRDVHGNTMPPVSCDFIITVKDNEAPQWSNCPDPIYGQTVTNDCYQLKCWAPPVVFDNCQAPGGPCPAPTVVVTVSDTTVMVETIGDDHCALFPVGTTYVYYTATDAEGNVSTCTVAVHISDDQAPTAMCVADFTVNLEPDGHKQLTVADIDNGSWDNCSLCDKEISRDGQLFGPNVDLTCADLNATVTITLRAKDCSAPDPNVDFCTVNVTVEDMQSPGIAECPADIIVGTDDDVCEAVVNYNIPTFNDGCGSPIPGTLIGGLASGSIFPIGTTLVTYTYTSNSGFTVECNFNVVVEDDQHPDLTCPANISGLTCTTPVPNPMSEVELMQAELLSDNCGITSLEVSDIDNGLSSCDNDGVHVIARTYRAFDAAGNSWSCVQTITYLEDFDAPNFYDEAGELITGFPLISGDCADDVPSVPNITANDGDGCGGVTVDYEETVTNLAGTGAPTCANQFKVTRTWVASDLCNNTRMISQVIEINDNINPVLASKPANQTLACIDDVEAAPVITATDNCGAATVVYSETTDPGPISCPSSTTIYRTWVATDACGNTDAHTQVISVQDNIAPILSILPPNLTVACAEDVEAAPVVTASDNCGVANLDFNEVVVSGGCVNQYTIVRSWVATDLCGNVTSHVQLVEVNDNIAPTFSGVPANAQVSCASQVPPVVHPVAADNCGQVNVDFSETTIPGDCPNSYTLVRRWVATDLCGNRAVVMQTIDVNDTQAPQFNVTLPPSQITFTCAEDVTAAVTLTAMDNCDGVVNVYYSEQLQPGGCPNDFTIVRTWTAEDLCGNLTAFTQFVIVFDNVPPTWNEAAPPSYSGDCAEDVTAAPTQTASDNCDAPVFIDFVEETLPGTCPNQFTVIRTWTASDICGNAVTRQQIITIFDNLAPTWNSPLPEPLVELECADQVPAAPVLTASDNCGAPIFVDFFETIDPGTCGNSFLLYRTWTATDDCGNVTSFTQVIDVQDDVDPDWNQPAPPSPVNVSCSEQVPPAPTQTASDNCVAPVLVDFSETIVWGTCPNSFQVRRRWVASDDCGNVTTRIQIVNVSDTAPPTWNQPAPDSIVLVQCADQVPAVPVQTASDNCVAPVYIDFSEVVIPGSCVDQFTVVRSWTAYDDCGNNTTRVQTIIVNDDTNPVMECPDDISVQCTPDEQPAYANFTEFITAGGSASDNCGLNQGSFGLLSQVQVSGVLFTRTYKIEDNCGNSATCVQNVHVLDTEPPVFVNCPVGPLVFGNDPDKCSAKVNWSIPVATDNCGIPTVVQISGPLVGSVTPVGNYVVIYKATDAAGNMDTCSFEVMVMDTQAPEFDADIIMPNDTMVQCDAVPTNCVFHGPLICTPLTNDDVNDNCTPSDSIAIVFTEVSTQCANQALCCYYTYTLTRTWTITDLAGNSRQHTQVIEVKDTTPPVAVCQNFTLELDKFGLATLNPKDLDGGSTDNCALNQFLTFTASQTEFDCSHLGQNTVILTVTDPCGNSSTCTAIVTVVEGPVGVCEPEASVVTTCMDNATNLDNGQFMELITIKALAMQTWTLETNTGLYSTNSPAPPGAPVSIPVGTELTAGTDDGIDNDGDGQVDEADEMVFYTLKGVHVECVGYSITLENNIGEVVTISNKACYPTPYFINLNDPFCLSTPPFEVLVGEVNGASGTVEILINGVPTNIFDAAALGIGFHTVKATFDAGSATTNLVINGVLVGGTMADALADPGCKQMITKIVQIAGTPTTVVCNDEIHISLDADCMEVITPDMVLEGSYVCYDDYTVILTYPFGTNTYSPPNKIDQTHIGKTIQFTLKHIISGNLCWGVVTVEDKLAPVITCPSDVAILCTQDEDNLTLTGQPTVVDCSPYTVVREDQYEQYSCAENNVVHTRVLRLWIATDQWGNKDSCLQTIDILRGTVDQVVFPNDVDYNCDAVPGSLQPGTTGWPTIAGVSLTTNGTGVCGLSVSFTDEVANICPGSYKIIRTWKINDWCSAGTGGPSSKEYVQYIKVHDLPPTLDFSNFTYDPDNDWYVIGTNGIVNGQCVSVGPLPVTIIDGVCNGIVEVKITTPIGPISNGGLLPFPGLGLGVHSITYIVEDECGNITSKTIKIYVKDVLPPAVSCDEFTQVALGGTGFAEVFAETFDDGTWDNCCLDGFLVRRMVDGPCDNDDLDDEFAPSVWFCCEDINDTITVVLRAFDCDGNYNDCMVQVFVEDKIKPACQAPAHVTVSCENFDPSLWAYGFATAVDNCCIDTITTSVNYALFDTLCNKGTITRTFRAFDCAGLSSQCTQRVVVNYEQDYYVRFPNDVIVTVCNGSGNYGEPTFFGEDCELLAVSFTDEIFTVVPDACFKIERTWHVVNWCTVNPNLPLIDVPNPNPNATSNHPSNLPGPIVSPVQTPGDPWKSTIVAIAPGQSPTNYSVFWDANANGYSYKQIIKVIDNEAPIFADCPASPVTIDDLTPNDPLFWNEMYWWDATIESHDLCEAPVDLDVTVTDSCGGANVSVKYLLFLDLDNDGTMETVVSSTNIPPANTVFFGNANNPNFTGGTAREFDGRPVPLNQKYRFNIDVVRNGNNATAKLIWDTPQQQANLNDNTMQGVNPQLPYGTHKIKWITNDGCGNEAVCEYLIIVKDGKKPTVVCLNGLSVNIMPGGMITLWASDFLQYAEDNCTPANLLKIGIVESDQSTGSFPVDFQGNPITNVTFDCTELGSQSVQLWAQDLAGNADFCETYVIVQDNMGNCGADPISVAGSLKTETLDGLEEASVELNATHPAMPPVSMVDMSDNFGDYVFANALPLAANYSVTPLKDDNHLNGVTTYDLVLISKHILGLDPLSSPYKMIAADANKSNSITTFDIVEFRKLILGIYNELPNNTSWRFVDKGFTFADPNNPFVSQFPEFLSVADVQTSQMDEDFVAMKVGDVNGSAIPNSLMSADDRTAGTLLFDVEDRAVKAGEEFTLTFKAAEKVVGYQFTLNYNNLEVVDITPGADMKLDNFGVFADAITTSFDGAATGEFTVKFRAKADGQISNMVGVSSRITKAEAYSNDSRLDVALRFNGTTIAGVGFELYQNTPNPFINTTMVGFHLPEATEATLTVYDETGRMIFTQTGDFAKGYNAITIDRAMLNTTGMLYYKLETATDSATRKMIQTK